jgi:DNA-binding XRE family transcriptional regulator
MGRSLKQVLAALPARERAKVNARYEELREEVESLRRLREIADRSQVEIARALGVKQPSVSKIERQTDMYLSTLRGYVEASGGALELIVRFPGRRAVRLAGLRDNQHPGVKRSKPRPRSSARA